MAGIKDKVTRIRLARRLDKAQRGNLGDIKSLGGGLFEMREHFGPGWRMYYLQREATLIVNARRRRQIQPSCRFQ